MDRKIPTSQNSYSNIEWGKSLEEIILNLDVPNYDFVECGTWTGSSAKILAKKCKGIVHLFDSWEGVSDIGEFDNPIYKELNWKAELDTCKAALSEYNNLSFYKGWIPSKFNEISKKQISLLHLDLSLYQPTKDSLDFFWDKIVDGGYAITNFHEGYSYGAEKAVRDFFKGTREIEIKGSGICIIKK